MKECTLEEIKEKLEETEKNYNPEEDKYRWKLISPEYFEDLNPEEDLGITSEEYNKLIDDLTLNQENEEN